MFREFLTQIRLLAPEGTGGGRYGMNGKNAGMVSRTVSFIKTVMPGTRDGMEPNDGLEPDEVSGIDISKIPFPVVVATETPAIVMDWNRWETIREILLISGAQLPVSKQIVLLDRHSCYGAVGEAVKGSCRNLRIEGSQLVGDIYFSTLSENEYTLVREGHLTDTSVGYRTSETNTLILKPGESGSISGRSFTNSYTDGLSLFIRSEWTPKEESLVAIGADEASKFREEAGSIPEGIKKLVMNEIDNKLNNRTNINISQEKREMETNTKTQEEVRIEERQRVSQIEDYGKRFSTKLPDPEKMVRDAVQSGMDVNEFREKVLSRMDTSKPVETPASEVGMSGKEINEYSIARAIVDIDGGKFRSNSLEREISEEIIKKGDLTPRSERSFFVPAEMQKRLNPKLNTRTVLSSASASIGGDLIGTEYLGGSFIEYLRNKTVMAKLGVTVLSGLRKDIVIPKQLSTTTFEMVGLGAATASNLTVGQVSATPHYGSATTEYHRSLLLQADPSIDSLVTNDLFGAAMVGIDNLIINGDGGAYEPRGFINETGVATVDCAGGVSWAKLVEFKRKLKKANADQAGDLKYLISPEMEELLLTTPKAGTYPVFLMGEDSKLAGCQTEVSNQVGANFIAAGVFSDIILCDWNLYEILVNPYGSNSRAGNIETTIFAAFDVITKRAASFAIRSDV